jgi:hypothetical protein
MKLRASPRLRPLSDVQYWTPELLYLLPQKGRVGKEKNYYFFSPKIQIQKAHPCEAMSRRRATPPSQSGLRHAVVVGKDTEELRKLRGSAVGE